MNSSEIEEYCKNVQSFSGVFAVDHPHLKGNMKENESCVINLDTMDSQGTHWVCIVNRGIDCCYFDSFGIIPDKRVIKYMETSRKNVLYNTAQLQDIKSITCGYFACYVIIECQKRLFLLEVILVIRQ